MRTRQDRMLHPWNFWKHAEIKPVSVNRAHYKNKKRTKEYNDYIEAWSYYLEGSKIPDDIEIKDMQFKITVHVGFSNRASDLDNILKPTIDIMQSHFGFNDKQIIHIEAFKHIVQKGKDYIYVKLFEVFHEDYPAYEQPIEELIYETRRVYAPKVC